MKGILIVLSFAFSFKIIAQVLCPIIPTPSVYKVIKGELYISDGINLIDSVIPNNVSSFLRTELKTQFGLDLNQNDKLPKVVFKRLRNVPTDYYSINVNNDIQIKYSSDASCFYAVNSLLQLIDGDRSGWYLKKSTVSDSPKYSWRGLHLDVSRHFFSVEEVKKFIDNMSMYKFNTFHWHLTDDQGWRIEIKKYPKLTAVGAYRDSTVDGHYSKTPRTYTIEKYGGFYTQEEIKEVVEYAQSKYVTIVPEIEMPGHSRAALAAYPELSCNGLKQEVPGLWGIFDDIYCSKDASIVFMQNVLEEVIELFPSEYIHIGGDEAPKTRWKVCDNCQKVIADNGLKDEHELQSYFIKRMDQFLTEKGKKLIGWDEILEGGLSPNAAVMSWRGNVGGREAAAQGHYVVMSPNTHCYFDYYQSSHPDEPLAIGGYLPLEKVYQFNPVPEGMSDADANYILGGQANLWSEYLPSMDQVEYMAFPRALALIQSLWCFSKPVYDDFLSVYLDKHQNYLKNHDVNYANSIHFPQLKVERTLGGINLYFSGAYVDSKFNISMRNATGEVLMENRIVSAIDSVFIAKGVKGESSLLSVNVKSINNEIEANYKFRVTDDVGAKIEMITAPHPKYNHNGSLNLVDGIMGRTPWKGSDWLGFNTNRVEFIVDLEEKRKTVGLRIGFLEDNGSWIYMPEKIQVFISKDKLKWRSVTVKDLKSVEVVSGMKQLLFKRKARYLKVVIKSMDVIPDGKDGGGHVPWTFIDEIEIL